MNSMVTVIKLSASSPVEVEFGSPSRIHIGGNYLVFWVFAAVFFFNNIYFKY